MDKDWQIKNLEADMEHYKTLYHKIEDHYMKMTYRWSEEMGINVTLSEQVDKLKSYNEYLRDELKRRDNQEVKKSQVVVDKKDLKELYEQIILAGEVCICSVKEETVDDVRVRLHELYERAAALCFWSD